MLRNRFIAALGLALVMGAAVAAPASAETVIDPCNGPGGGTCGYWEAYDTHPGNKGGICKYETGSYDLDWIKIRPPLMHGPYSNKTKVQWKFNILRSTDFGSTYTGIYNSSWQVAMANTAIPARDGSGFSWRTWYASDPNPTGYFKVRILLRWKDAAGNSVGDMKIEYDHYQRKWSSSSNHGLDHCIQDW